MSGCSKFWVHENMYLVDDEVYDYVEKLQDENEAMVAEQRNEIKRLEDEVEELVEISTGLKWLYLQKYEKVKQLKRALTKIWKGEVCSPDTNCEECDDNCIERIARTALKDGD